MESLIEKPVKSQYGCKIFTGNLDSEVEERINDWLRSYEDNCVLIEEVSQGIFKDKMMVTVFYQEYVPVGD